MNEQEKRAELEAKMEAYVGIDAGDEVAPDPVNEVMIRQFCEVIGDENPIFTDAEAARKLGHEGVVAPVTMMHPWVMPGMYPGWDWSADDAAVAGEQPLNKEIELTGLLGEYGYSSVVGTDQEEFYHRYPRPGEKILCKKVIESLSEQKATALGVGYFMTVRRTFLAEDGEEIGWSTFRSLYYRPAQQPQAASDEAAPAAAKPQRLRAPLGHDNQWWWEGLEKDELLIQKCADCGELRHPPRPMCGACQSLRWDSVPAGGRGTVYSFTVLHHPKFPGFDYPFVAALIELEEGTRIVSNVVGCDTSDVHIGMPVELSVEKVDDEMKLPIFRPAR